MGRTLPAWAYAGVAAAMFLAFAAAVLARPDAATWAAAGTSSVLFTKVLYDYAEDDVDVDEMFEEA